jgi:hypothetical protein
MFMPGKDTLRLVPAEAAAVLDALGGSAGKVRILTFILSLFDVEKESAIVYRAFKGHS